MNHYEVLGVEPTADLRAIRRAWRIKVRLLHPDRHEGAPAAVRAEAAKETLRVNDAWHTLRDPQLRLRYDLHLLRARDASVPRGAGSSNAAGDSGIGARRDDEPGSRAARRPSYGLLDVSTFLLLLVAVCFMVVGMILLSNLMP